MNSFGCGSMYMFFVSPQISASVTVTLWSQRTSKKFHVLVTKTYHYHIHPLMYPCTFHNMVCS